MDTTGAAGESFLDFRRGLRRGLLARFLRMAAAAHGDLGGEDLSPLGVGRRGPRTSFPFGGFGGRGSDVAEEKAVSARRGASRCADPLDESLCRIPTYPEIEARSGGSGADAQVSLSVLQQLETRTSPIEQPKGARYLTLLKLGALT
jgi:hypothetical protein